MTDTGPLLFLVALDDLICWNCGGPIPPGHKYWYHSFYRSSEHTNCELYSVEYIKLKIETGATRNE